MAVAAAKAPIPGPRTSLAHHRVRISPDAACSCKLAPRRRLKPRRRCYQRAHASYVGAATPEDPDSIPDTALASEPVTASASPEPTAEPAPPRTLWGKVKRFFGGDALDRKRLAALGLGAVASYGMISNVTYGGGLAVAWIAFVRQKQLSPLQPGQWPVFLAFYAGFWTVQNFVRPLRFALAVSLAPVFEKFLNSLPMSRRNAFGVYLFLLGTITSVCVFGSIALFAGPQAFSRAPIVL